MLVSGQKWVKKGFLANRCMLVPPLPPKDAVQRPGNTRPEDEEEQTQNTAIAYGKPWWITRGSHPGLTYQQAQIMKSESVSLDFLLPFLRGRIVTLFITQKTPK